MITMLFHYYNYFFVWSVLESSGLVASATALAAVATVDAAAETADAIAELTDCWLSASSVLMMVGCKKGFLI